MNLNRIKVKGLILFACMLFFQTTLYAQGVKRVTIKGDQITVKEALLQIRTTNRFFCCL